MNKPNHTNICIFFLDNEQNLRQGYLLVDNKKIDEIELEFKKSEPLVVFNKYKINISNDAIKKNIPNKFY